MDREIPLKLSISLSLIMFVFVRVLVNGGWQSHKLESIRVDMYMYIYIIYDVLESIRLDTSIREIRGIRLGQLTTDTITWMVPKTC